MSRVGAGASRTHPDGRGPPGPDGIPAVMPWLLFGQAAQCAATGASCNHFTKQAGMQEPHTLDMLQYACSPRVTALHTGLLNARRLVRMITHPVVAATSNAVWSFASASQASPAGCYHFSLHAGRCKRLHIWRAKNQQ